MCVQATAMQGFQSIHFERCTTSCKSTKEIHTSCKKTTRETSNSNYSKESETSCKRNATKNQQVHRTLQNQLDPWQPSNLLQRLCEVIEKEKPNELHKLWSGQCVKATKMFMFVFEVRTNKLFCSNVENAHFALCIFENFWKVSKISWFKQAIMLLELLFENKPPRDFSKFLLHFKSGCFGRFQFQGLSVLKVLPV